MFIKYSYQQCFILIRIMIMIMIILHRHHHHHYKHWYMFWYGYLHHTTLWILYHRHQTRRWRMFQKNTLDGCTSIQHQSNGIDQSGCNYTGANKTNLRHIPLCNLQKKRCKSRNEKANPGKDVIQNKKWSSNLYPV